MTSLWRHKVEPWTEIPYFPGFLGQAIGPGQRIGKLITSYHLQPWYPTYNDTECCSSTEYAGLRITMLTTNRSWTYHFTCDVTVDLIFQGIDTKFSHNIQHISRYVIAKSLSRTTSRCGDIASKKMGAKNMPPAVGGWRGGSAAAGLTLRLRVNGKCLRCLSENKISK